MSIIRPIRSLTLSAVVAAAVLSACGADSNADLATASPAEAATAGDAPATEDAESATTLPTGTATTVEVTTLDNTFVEEKVNVAVGTEVVWRNGGRNDHDIVPVVDGEGWGVDTASFHPGDAYSYVFTEPGEYAYYCTIHGTADVGMTGTIIVT